MQYINSGERIADAISSMNFPLRHGIDPLIAVRKVWKSGEIGLLDLLHVVRKCFEIERREAARLVAKATFDVERAGKPIVKTGD